MQSFTYAIADLHGNYKALLRALAVIRKHRGERYAHLGFSQDDCEADRMFCLQDTIVFLGDYIDRGWDSADVLEFFSTEEAVKKAVGIEFGQSLVVHLLGNHDDMFANMLERHLYHPNDDMTSLEKDPIYKYCKEFYDKYGGAKTDTSYLIMNSKQGADKTPKVAGSIFPMKHLEFLRSLRHYYYDRYRVFVHGFCPRDDGMLFSVEKNKVRTKTILTHDVERMLINAALKNDDTLWGRFRPYDNYTFADRHIVHGHTPVDTPELFMNRTNLDTNSWKTGVVHIGVFDNSKPGGPVTVMDTNDFTVSWFEGMKK